MTSREQISILSRPGKTRPFAERIKESHQSPLTATSVEILQINVGKRCNLSCKHCHVNAGPNRTEVMSRPVLEKCLDASKNSEIKVIDITGGAPEMNPHLEWFITEAASTGKRILVRSNLVILLEDEYRKFIDLFAQNRVEIVTSLPDYSQIKSDRQRGSGTFDKILQVIGLLNERGYGKSGSGLLLDIVHNPVGAYLPGLQNAIEYEYRHRLGTISNITFNNLFCITNIPVGRYLDYLIRTENYQDYIEDLYNAFNPAAVDNVMCKTTISVGWDGTLYDCDFNQMLDLPVDHNAPRSIDEFHIERLKNRKIIINNHCYGCVAGTGSSCQGATTE